MRPSTSDDNEIARKLLDEAYADGAPAGGAPAPAPSASGVGITPFVVPAGYTLRETYRTHPDGSMDLIREAVPLASPPTAAQQHAAPVAGPAGQAAGRTAPAALPSWLTASRARIKAAAYLGGGTALAALGGVYGPQIASGVTAAAAAAWTATLTVLKIVGIAVLAGVAVRIACGGGKRGRTGTFEGEVKGTWRND
ncbi:hypothetical protein [Streptomyces anthocyanicus]|uniref:hypothetical protein n=1 Tax=Streptomyces anthocyanicus TaxID=68174 RepID=UPI003823A28D